MKQVTVFGGTGFLGSRIVRSLCKAGTGTVRIAVRHPEKAASLIANRKVRAIAANIRDDRSVDQAIAGSDAVVNAVSLYVQTNDATFHDIHVAGARRVAAAARKADAGLVHISGIGSDSGSSQRYIRTRGEGEREVQTAHPEASIIRPAVMFSRKGGLVGQILKVLNVSPVFPLFGNGGTLLQPVYRDDIARAVVSVLEKGVPMLCECGGPKIKPYREIVSQIAGFAGSNPHLVPVPFPLWQLAGIVAERLPGAPLTRDQVALMRIDNVANKNLPSLEDLDIQPRSIADVLGSVDASPCD